MSKGGMGTPSRPEQESRVGHHPIYLHLPNVPPLYAVPVRLSKTHMMLQCLVRTT